MLPYQLAQLVVRILRDPLHAVRYLRNPLFSIVCIPDQSSVQRIIPAA